MDGGGGQRHVAVHTENYSPLTSSGGVLMQRSSHFLDQNFVFGWNKKWAFSVNIN